MNETDTTYFDAAEMIGLKEFARRMDACVNTVRSWIACGKLVEGRHFYRQGRKYFFPWSPQLTARLMEDWTPKEPPKRPKLKSLRANRGALRYKC